MVKRVCCIVMVTLLVGAGVLMQLQAAECNKEIADPATKKPVNSAKCIVVGEYLACENKTEKERQERHHDRLYVGS